MDSLPPPPLFDTGNLSQKYSESQQTREEVKSQALRKKRVALANFKASHENPEESDLEAKWSYLESMEIQAELYHQVFKRPHLLNLKKHDFSCHGFLLIGKLASFRKVMFSWLLDTGMADLEICHDTVEHCFRLFDLHSRETYHTDKYLNNGNQEAILEFITCLHLSCKYMEIYPPTLRDILLISGQPLSKKENVLLKEMAILGVINFQMIIALPSQWHSLNFKKKLLPDWGYLLLPQISWDWTAEEISQNIDIIEKALQEKGLPIGKGVTQTNQFKEIASSAFPPKPKKTSEKSTLEKIQKVSRAASKEKQALASQRSATIIPKRKKEKKK